MAEGMRFELTVRVDPVRRFSKPLPSATRPPLRRERRTYPGYPGHSVCPTMFRETPPPGQTRTVVAARRVIILLRSVTANKKTGGDGTRLPFHPRQTRISDK